MKTIKLFLRSTATYLLAACLSVAFAQTITVDFNQSAYPPIMNKWGYNSYWNESGTAEFDEVNVAGSFGMQMAGGLVEINQQEVGETVPQIFTRPNSTIQVNLQSDYQQLRSTLKSNAMVQFTQFCGTPMEMFESPKYQQPLPDSYPNIFPNLLYDYYLQSSTPGDPNDYKYRWSSAFGGGGNSYPLPDLTGMDEYADAWADYAEQMYAQDKQAQIFGFWQEPTHTIVSKMGVEFDGAANGQVVNLNHFLDFYTRAALAIKAKNPDFMLAGFQLNDYNATNLKIELENGQMGTWAEWILEEYLRRENSNSIEYPLDFFALQAFSDEHTPTVIDRLRMALKNERFNKTPVILNRYKNKLADGSNGNSLLYNTSEGISDWLDNIELIYNAPDISYLLVSSWKKVVANSWMWNDVADMLGQMHANRKQVSTPGSLTGKVKSLVSGDDDGISAILWNTTTATEQFTFNMDNIPASLQQGTQLKVYSLENNSRMTLESTTAISGSGFNKQLSLSAYGVKFLKVEGSPETLSLANATYAKHEIYVDRYETNPTQMPDGVGHYDVQSSKLIVGTNVAGVDVAGLSGVILRDLPSANYGIRAKINSFALPAPSNSTKLGLRVDYLDGDNTLKTVQYHSSDYGASGHFTNIDWRAKVDLLKIPSDFSNNGFVEMNISGNAPAAWANADNGARRVQVSLLLRDAQAGSVVSATLDDNFTPSGSGNGGIAPTPGSVVFIESVSTDMRIRPVTQSMDDSEIELKPYTMTGNRLQWTVEDAGGGYLRFVNVEASRRLRPINSSEGSLLKVSTTSQTGDWTQWTAQLQSGDEYLLINKKSGKHMRPLGSTGGSNVEQTSTSDNTTLWRFMPVN